MNTAREASRWRDIVNATPDEKETYAEQSVNDHLDLARNYYAQFIKGVAPENLNKLAKIAREVNELVDAYQAIVGGLEGIRVQGNGYYLPEHGEDFTFFDGTQGISGEFAGFSIQTALPTYRDMMGEVNDAYTPVPLLCLELRNYRTYSNTGIALEADEANGNAIIPLTGQDLAYTRHNFKG